MKPENPIIDIVNRKASFEYFLIERFEAGIQLTGTEIKSIRQGAANLKDSYCLFEKEELFVKNLFIAEYKFGNIQNHKERRDRKLLLTKRELKKIKRRSEEKSFTIIPVSLYINERGLAKLEIALAKGKKVYDKRKSIKEKDQKRDLERSRDY